MGRRTQELLTPLSVMGGGGVGGVGLTLATSSELD